MRIGGRSLGTIARAVAQRQHYRALVGMLRTCLDAGDVARRYLLGCGAYPCEVRLRTPVGLVRARLYVRDEVLTLNEVFCREDYPAGPNLGAVVDLGSNIGLSALYFLTRNPTSRCYLYEPVAANVAHLRENLAGLEARYQLEPVAVGPVRGEVAFGVEPTGRYGGVGVAAPATLQVRCRHINDVLDDVLRREGTVDILKIDTEGLEAATIAAINPGLLAGVGRIYVELRRDERPPVPLGFAAVRWGTTWWLTRRGAAL